MLVTILTFLWSLHESNQVLENQINQNASTLREYNQFFCIANVIYFSCMLTAGWTVVVEDKEIKGNHRDIYIFYS